MSRDLLTLGDVALLRCVALDLPPTPIGIARLAAKGLARTNEDGRAVLTRGGAYCLLAFELGARRGAAGDVARLVRRLR